MADQLRGIQARLTELAELEPSAELLDHTNVSLLHTPPSLGELRTSVRADASTSDPVQPDQEILDTAESYHYRTGGLAASGIRTAKRSRTFLNRTARLATAAVVLLVVGLTLRTALWSARNQVDPPRTAGANPTTATSSNEHLAGNPSSVQTPANSDVSVESGVASVANAGVASWSTARLDDSTAEYSHRFRNGVTPSTQSICRHDSPIEAAECDKLGCMHRAIIIPRMSRRYFGSTRRNSSPN